jgi:hypothetical protein
LIGLFTGGEQAVPQAQYGYTPEAPTLYEAGRHFGEGGMGEYWAGLARSEDVAQAQALAAAARGREDMALQMMLPYVRGEESMAMGAGRIAMEQAQQQIAAQAASAPGGYNPALERAALLAMSGQGQAIAGQTAQAAQAERIAAHQAFLQAAQQQRASDLQQQQLAAATEAQYLGAGQSERMSMLQARQNYEQMLLKASMNISPDEMRERMEDPRLAATRKMGESWAFTPEEMRVRREADAAEEARRKKEEEEAGYKTGYYQEDPNQPRGRYVGGVGYV